jgi:hypothetical protein
MGYCSSGTWDGQKGRGAVSRNGKAHNAMDIMNKVNRVGRATRPEGWQINTRSRTNDAAGCPKGPKCHIIPQCSI